MAEDGQTMRFIFEQIRLGGDRNFGYLIGDRAEGAGILVDPSYVPETMVEEGAPPGAEDHPHPEHPWARRSREREHAGQGPDRRLAGRRPRPSGPLRT